ncbi:MAG: hypothetical protein RLZ35_609 [Pseudomonadota bacterium]
MQHNKIKKQRRTGQTTRRWVAGITGLMCLVASPAFASVDAFASVANVHSKTDALETKGGIKTTAPVGSDYGFTTGGVLRFDGAKFMGSSDALQGQYPNSIYVKTADWSIKGSLKQNLFYELRLKMDGGNTRVADALLLHKGILPNSTFAIGQLNPSFSLDNENSTSWQPFIDSAATSVFFPYSGLGIRYSAWGKNFGYKLAALQPEHASTTPPENRGRDRIQYSARAFFSPVNQPGDVWHLGADFAFREIDYTNYGGGLIKRLTMNVYPGAKARNTATLVQLAEGSTAGISARHLREFDLELARQWGPVLLFGEYYHMHVNRPVQQNVTFKSWYFQGSWLLTGESRQYSAADGEFSTVKPNHSYGAWEVAARYTYVDLNDRDVLGGSQHDLALGLNWFYSEHIRVSVNYVRANVHPAFIYSGPALRKLNIVAGRLQIRW